MFRSKLGLLGLCAVLLGVIAMTASSAQAALSWLVLNASGTTATELKAALIGEKDTADMSLLAKMFGSRVWFTCTNMSLSGANLELGGTLTTGFKAVFTGCEAYLVSELGTALGCHLKTTGTAEGTLETNELKGRLELHTLAGGGTEVLTKVEPVVAGGPLITILTEACELPESIPVRGFVYLKDCLGRALTHEVKHLVEQGPLTSIFVFTHSVEHLDTRLNGSIWVKLGGAHLNLKWAAMDV